MTRAQDIERQKLSNWLLERATNCMRIAETKSGDDRAGWLEDADYFSNTINALDEAEAAEATQAVLAEALDGLVNDSLVQQYHGVKAYERAQAALSPGAGDRVRGKDKDDV